MSGKADPIYRAPNPATNAHYRKLAEELKKKQMAPPKIEFHGKGGRRVTRRRVVRRRKTQRRKRC